MKKAGMIFVGFALFFLNSCSGARIPEDKMDYIGKWDGVERSIIMTPDGRVYYTRMTDGIRKSLTAPLRHFIGDDFEVGIPFFSTVFRVTDPPRFDGKKWRMTVDGVELVRTLTDRAETQDLLAIQYTKASPLKFEINKNKIKEVYLDEHGKQYSVGIELLPQFAQELSVLTANNIGYELEIVFEDQILVKAVIKADIQSGMIGIDQNIFSSRQEAMDLVSRLKEQELP